MLEKLPAELGTDGVRDEQHALKVVAWEVPVAIGVDRYLFFPLQRLLETNRLDRLREIPVACPSEAAIRL